MKNRVYSWAGAAMVVVLCLTGNEGFASGPSILNSLTTVTPLSSTIPGNGDVNPYGVAEVPRTTGNLEAGHFLVSNFNASSNFQGTGTTIVDVGPDGSMSLFAQINAGTLPGACPGGVGLTTALVVLRSGWVIVGSLPTTDGMADTIGDGCLIVLNSHGTPVETFYGSLIKGPWDMTLADDETNPVVFFSNVWNETAMKGTVVRLNLRTSNHTMPWIESMTVVGSGFSESTNPAALVVGPTGVALSRGRDEGRGDDSWGRDREQVLYVADSMNNRIAVIPDAMTRTTSAGTGYTLSSGGALNDPLGLVVATDGHILTVNGNNGYIIEMDQWGHQIATKLIDNTGTPPGNGTLFGLVYDPGLGIVFVDDGSNTLNLLN